MTRKRTRKQTRREKSDEGGFEFPDVSFSPEPEITPGLVPIGNTGFYQSPVEPVDPHDCERWPSSPYCGSTGFSRDRLGLDTQYSVNPCEICMVIDPTLVFVNLPPYTICKRSNAPGCIPEVPLPPPDYPPEDSNGYQRTCRDGTYAYIGIPADTEIQGMFFLKDTDVADIWNALFSKALTELKSYYSNLPDGWSGLYFAPGYVFPAYDMGYNSDLGGAQLIKVKNGEKSYFRIESPTLDVQTQYYGFYDLNGEEQFFNPGGFSVVHKIVEFSVPGCEDAGNMGPVGSPPYPLDREPCCMACSQDSEELLRLIYLRLGGQQYPIPVPQSLLANKGNGRKNIESITEFMHWFVLQFDALTGQFPIEIEVKDNDPTKEGDQKEKFTVPNLAEGIAEVLGLALSANINTQTLINALIRTLTEAGSAKVHALETRYIAQAIADYLAFDTKEVKTDVGMTFTPGKEELDEILQERDQQVPLVTYNDDRDFREEMTDLLQAAAIIRAVFYRKVGKTGNIKQELKDRFKDLIKLGMENPASPDVHHEPDRTNDFDRFIEDAETGFANTAGNSDVLHPYGRTYDQRPKIRELGNPSDNTSERI